MLNVDGLLGKTNEIINNKDKEIDNTFLDGIIKKINMMPNSKEKAMEICFVCAYINYLSESKQIENIDVNKILSQINELDIFYKHFAYDEKRDINSLLEIPYILNPIYKDILNYANNYPLFTTLPPNANINNLVDYAIDFLNSFDKDLPLIYLKCYKNGLFSEVSLDKHGGTCHRLINDLSGIIVNYNTYNIYKAFAIIHEIGHAYHNYLNSCYPNLVRNSLTKESIPRIFEHLFLLYLRENHLMNENDIDKYERFFILHQLKILNSVYIANKLIINDIIKTDFFIDKMNATMSFNDYYNLSIIKPKDNEYQQFISFVDNYYTYAFLLSQVIRENYLENKEETKKLIKEIPALSRELDALDIINIFDKNDYLNATKKNISRVLSKTFYKK